MRGPYSRVRITREDCPWLVCVERMDDVQGWMRLSKEATPGAVMSRLCAMRVHRQPYTSAYWEGVAVKGDGVESLCVSGKRETRMSIRRVGCPANGHFGDGLTYPRRGFQE